MAAATCKWPGRPAVIAGEFGWVQAEAEALPVEQGPRLRARLAVDQSQPLPGHVVKTAHASPGPDHQALTPGGEPDHLGAAGNLGRDVGVS